MGVTYSWHLAHATVKARGSCRPLAAWDDFLAFAIQFLVLSVRLLALDVRLLAFAIHFLAFDVQLLALSVHPMSYVIVYQCVTSHSNTITNTFPITFLYKELLNSY